MAYIEQEDYIPEFLRKRQAPVVKPSVLTPQVEEVEEESYVPEALRQSLPPTIKPEIVQPQPEQEEVRDDDYVPEAYNVLIAPQEKQEEQPLTREEVLNDPNRLTSIREYMLARKGEHFAEKSDEEVLEEFMTHMRYVNANDITTLGEYRFITQSDDSRKAKAANAYQVYDEIGNLFQSGDASDIAGGILDYGSAVLLSPSTYFGAVVGKAAVQAGSTAARRTMITTAMRQAYRTGGREAAQAVAATAAKKNAMASVGVATLTDAGVNTFQDYAYQKTMMMSGHQEDYSLFQTAIAATGGLVGGGVAAAPELTRLANISGLKDAGEVIETTSRARAAAAAKSIIPRVKDVVAKLNRSSEKWVELVKKGETLDPSLDEAIEFTKWFFDKSNPDSILNIIVGSGAKLNLGKGKRFTEELARFAKNIPPEQLDELNNELAPLGLKFGEMVDIVANMENKGGVALNLAQQAKQVARNAMSVAAANSRVNNNLVQLGRSLLDAPEKEDAANPQVMRYAASVWRRLLVSHPATTAVNILGWGQAYGARSLAEVLHGTGRLGLGMASAIVNQDFAKQNFQIGKSLLANQIFKARSLLDPYSSREAFDALVAGAPEKLHNDALRSFFGGVDTVRSAEIFGMAGKDGQPANAVVRGAEAYADWASSLTLVKAQDVFTKSISGLASLDKMTRLKLGKGIDQVLKDGEEHLITDEMWNSTVKDLLKDTFSADYTHGNPLSWAANLAEGLSNAPVVGFLFPFGRFMANNIAFLIEYSPLSLAPVAARMGSRAAGFKTNILQESNFEFGERVAKAAVGTVALYTLLSTEKEKMEQGLQWYEEEGEDGTIINRQNLAPASVYRLTARIGSLIKEGKGVPPELWAELGNQLGPGALLREVSGPNALTELLGVLGSAETAEENVNYTHFLGELMAGISGQVLSGFTRPLDAPNDVLGMATETDVAIDRRQATSFSDKMVQELTRYTNNLFAPLLGEPVEEGGPPIIGTPLRSATRPEGDVFDPNPISSLMGRKEQPPKNDIDKLLGVVNLPPFIMDQRTAIPAYDRYMNEKVAPLLNKKAKLLMESKAFNKLPHDMKVKQVRDLLNDTRKEVRDAIRGGTLGGPDARLLDERRRWTGLDATYRTAARNALNITTPDDKLSQFQIKAMREWIDYTKDFNKRVR